MKPVSPDYYSEHVLGKSIIIHGVVWHNMAFSGARITILNSLSDVEAYENALKYNNDCCFFDWTCIFTGYSPKKVYREVITFDNEREMIEHAKSFFAENESG